MMVIVLIAAWAAGLAAYGVALKGLYGETLSLDNWVVIGVLTLVAWLLACALLTLPLLRGLSRRLTRPARARVLSVAGAALAIVPVWLTLGVWDGWHPRYLLSQEAGLLGVLYGTSGIVLGLWLARAASRTG